MRRSLSWSSVLAACSGPRGVRVELAGRRPVLVGYSFDPDHPYAGGQHRGIDIGAGSGATVLAPAAGTVTFAGTRAARAARASRSRPRDGYSVTLTHLGSIGVQQGCERRRGRCGRHGRAERRRPRSTCRTCTWACGSRPTHRATSTRSRFLPASAAPATAPATTTAPSTTPASVTPTAASGSAPTATTTAATVSSANTVRVVTPDEGADPTAGDEGRSSQEPTVHAEPAAAPAPTAAAPAPPAAAAAPPAAAPAPPAAAAAPPAAAAAPPTAAPAPPAAAPAPPTAAAGGRDLCRRRFAKPALAEPAFAETRWRARCCRSSPPRSVPSRREPRAFRVLPVVAPLSAAPAARRTAQHAPARARAARPRPPIVPAPQRQPPPVPVVRAVRGTGAGFPAGLLALGMLVAAAFAAIGARESPRGRSVSLARRERGPAEDPGRGRVAVRERAAAHRPCGRLRRAAPTSSPATTG